MGNSDIRELVELTDVLHKEHPSLDIVGHFLFDINEDLTKRGINSWSGGSKGYLTRRIGQLQNRVGMFTNRESIDYINRVITLMENIRDAGISLPLSERNIW